ncbi:MAG: acyltransferase [Caulobacter sp.]|nr:acyltransferase [Caulobacter sp.]
MDNARQPRPALDSLQAGRAFAALAVLLFHVELTLALPQHLDRDTFPVFRSGYSGVHFFFVLSGFVILMAHRADIGRADRLATFVWKRARRIYPPLWAALLIFIPATLMLPLLNNGVGFTVLDVLSAVVLTPDINDPLLSVIWTLRHEALFYAVFGLILWRPKTGLAVAAVWMMLSATLPWLGIDGWLRFFFTSQHLLFAFGAAAFLAFERGKVPLPGLVMTVGLLLFVATWAIPVMKLPLNGIIGNWAFGLGATLAILGAASLERARGLPVPRWLSFLGEASYAIYLAHAPAIYAATAGALALAPQLRQAPAALFLLVTAASLAAGVAFHLWVERPLLARLPHTPPRGGAGEVANTSAP